jgi:hypothetical protein
VQWKKEYRTFLFAALAAGSVPVDAEKSKHLPVSVTVKPAHNTEARKGTKTALERGS